MHSDRREQTLGSRLHVAEGLITYSHVAHEREVRVGRNLRKLRELADLAGFGYLVPAVEGCLGTGEDVRMPLRTYADVRGAWLAYARAVVDPSSEHRKLCESNGGSPGPPYKKDVRWPGYLGSGYRPGGMMIVANIHTRFDSGGLKGDEAFGEHAAQVVRDWAEDRSTDDEYLDRNAEVYERGLACWRVKDNTHKPRRHLGIPISDVVYTNGARCQAADAATALQRHCQRFWSVRRLVDDLRPGLVIVASTTVLREAAPAPWPAWCTVIGLHQKMNADLLRHSPWQPPDGGIAFESWKKYLPDMWARAQAQALAV